MCPLPPPIQSDKVSPSKAKEMLGEARQELRLEGLLSPLRDVFQIGPQRVPLLERLVGSKVIHLLWHLPISVVNRQFVKNVAQAPLGQEVTLLATPLQPPRGHHPPYRIPCSDGEQTFDLVFFNARTSYLKKTIRPGQKHLISGKLERYSGRLQMTHPDHLSPLDPLQSLNFQVGKWTGTEPIYPLTAGITSKLLRYLAHLALKDFPSLPEWIPERLLNKYRWPSLKESFQALHNPQTPQDLLVTSKERCRLMFDELLAHQLALGLSLQDRTCKKGIALQGTGQKAAQVLTALPFDLTHSQKEALDEIEADLRSSRQMIRLLQGDVGCGKTLVAFLAMVQAVESKFQAAFLVPTDILARQHFQSLLPLAEKAGIHLSLLTAREKGKKRQELLQELEEGTLDILIGTHALLQKDVRFAKLGLAVIDEQHRFGVKQRLTLSSSESDAPEINILTMTATPIPRTLLLAHQGEMSTSHIREKPKGRQPIQTRTLSLDKLPSILDGLHRALQEGERIYWVCPLIEESEKLDLAAATERFEHLKTVFGPCVGLIHGKMKAAEKDQTMEAFIKGEIQILVATTVIEVGVDVKEAGIMVIEQAERFGLAQLHQLRGRVGRNASEKLAHCLLLYNPKLNPTAQKRLAILKESNDGFHLAEADLRLRGGGELLGTRQSGLPDFKFADFNDHFDLSSDFLELALEEALTILKEDPDLSAPHNLPARLLLHLFGKEESMRYKKSG